MRTDYHVAQATAEPAVEMPDWYTAFNMPWQWDASGTLARVRWLVLPPGVEEGSVSDCAVQPIESILNHSKIE